MFPEGSYSGKTARTALANSPLSGDRRKNCLNVLDEDQSAAIRKDSKGTPACAAAEVEALLVE